MMFNVISLSRRCSSSSNRLR